MPFIKETVRGVRNFYGPRTTDLPVGSDAMERNIKSLVLSVNNGTLVDTAGIRMPKNAEITRVVAKGDATVGASVVLKDGSTTIATYASDPVKVASGGVIDTVTGITGTGTVVIEYVTYNGDPV